VHLLDEAVNGLPDGWPEATLDEDDHEHMASLASDDARMDYVANIEGELLDEEIWESRHMTALALEGWDSFAEAAALQLQRGLLPGPRAVWAAYRRGVQWVRFKRLERRHKKRLEKRTAERRGAKARRLTKR
jgi:hypothetical protein